MSTTLLRQAFIIGFVSIIALVAALSLPRHALAVGSAADAMCNPVTLVCGCGQVMGPHGCTGGANMWQCPCADTTNSFVTAGSCIGPNKCLAKTTGGGAIGDASQIMQLAKQIMDMLKGGGGGGGGGSPPPPAPAPGTGGAGCPNIYNVSKPSADPCAIYTRPPSSSIDVKSLPLNTSAELIDAVTGDTSPPPASTNIDTSTTNTTPAPVSSGLDLLPVPAPTIISTPTSNETPTTPTLPATTKPSAIPLAPTLFGPTAGVSGDIRTLDGGATVIINNQNTQANTEVAGFYGSDTAGNQQPQGLVSGMCQSRPWSTNFLNYIIPPSFFDSICSLRGYQVGVPKPTTQVIVTKNHPPTPRVVAATTTTATTTPSGPVIPPEANIWAVPTSVPLGSRTTLFWNTKGVTSCTVTSPDGSFNQASLSGGGATVPLSGSTVYTISCLTPSGGHITNFTTVNLSN